jgi:hypothetical protein
LILTSVGSERARDAKTAGATLAEAGKINESLMYLGQCLQMQSDSHAGGSKVSYLSLGNDRRLRRTLPACPRTVQAMQADGAAILQLLPISFDYISPWTIESSGPSKGCDDCHSRSSW